MMCYLMAQWLRKDGFLGMFHIQWVEWSLFGELMLLSSSQTAGSKMAYTNLNHLSSLLHFKWVQHISWALGTFSIQTANRIMTKKLCKVCNFLCKAWVTLREFKVHHCSVMAAAGRTKDVSRQGFRLLANEADSCSSLALLPHPLGTWTPCDIPHNAGAFYAAWPQGHCEKARSPSA